MGGKVSIRWEGMGVVPSYERLAGVEQIFSLHADHVRRVAIVRRKERDEIREQRIQRGMRLDILEMRRKLSRAPLHASFVVFVTVTALVSPAYCGCRRDVDLFGPRENRYNNHFA